MLNKQDIDSFDSKQCNVAEKRAIFKCQPFIVVDKNNIELVNKNNFAKLFKYNSNSTAIALSNADTQLFFDARMAMMKMCFMMIKSIFAI